MALLNLRHWFHIPSGTCSACWRVTLLIVTEPILGNCQIFIFLSYREHSCPRDRPYRCQECGDCLYSYSSLRIHQLLHHGENSKCPHCNAGFAHADLLRAHVRRSHADILLKIKNDSRCELCNVVCGSKDKLKNHNRAVHKILKDKQGNQ